MNSKQKKKKKTNKISQKEKKQKEKRKTSYWLHFCAKNFYIGPFEEENKISDR